MPVKSASTQARYWRTYPRGGASLKQKLAIVSGELDRQNAPMSTARGFGLISLTMCDDIQHQPTSSAAG